MASKTKPLNRKYLSNLLRCFKDATDTDKQQGLDWYQQAHGTALDLSTRYGVSLEAATGVIAALSPGSEWSRNIGDAYELIDSYHRGNRGQDLPRVGSYGQQNIAKAERILNGEQPLDVLGGNKVRAFYANILDPEDPETVTIDRHAKFAALRTPNINSQAAVRDSEYDFFARHYRHVARKLGLTPATFQAIIWVTWRRTYSELTTS